jgi:7,8-dihydropterin-6-yl-methyl-4-(beta-D-ribofuranosyl)aminobenzene 5'-phosphate synthase
MKKVTRREAMIRAGQFIIGAAAGTSLSSHLSGCSNQEPDQKTKTAVMEKTAPLDIKDIKLTVVYDNISFRKDLRTDWGFSCLIQGLDKTILFDLGRYDNIFISNMSKLEIDLFQIDELVISHDHPDHIGGVKVFLEKHPGVRVHLVKSFRSGFKKMVRKFGAELSEINQPCHITRNCISTGEMKSIIRNEHALIILTNKGLVVITGCAHPGVVDIVERSQQITGKKTLLVMGGFHLLNDYDSSIRKKVKRLKELGVRYVAPSHCTGGEAFDIFAKEFGEQFILSGAGRTITGNDLVG